MPNPYQIVDSLVPLDLSNWIVNIYAESLNVRRNIIPSNVEHADQKQVRGLIADVLSHHSRLDVLVTGLTQADPPTPLTRGAREDLDFSIQVRKS
jgi:hypothetical protein